MSLKDKKMNGKIYYSANSDAIDEIVVLGYGKELGVGVLRILGKNMNPSKMMKNVEINETKQYLKEIRDLLK